MIVSSSHKHHRFLKLPIVYLNSVSTLASVEEYTWKWEFPL